MKHTQHFHWWGYPVIAHITRTVTPPPPSTKLGKKKSSNLLILNHHSCKTLSVSSEYGLDWSEITWKKGSGFPHAYVLFCAPSSGS